jgi:hypothetical protein
MGAEVWIDLLSVQRAGDTTSPGPESLDHV